MICEESLTYLSLKACVDHFEGLGTLIVKGSP